MTNAVAPTLTSRDLEHINRLASAPIGQSFMSARWAKARTPAGDWVNIRLGEHLKLYASRQPSGVIVLRVVDRGRLILLTPADLLDLDIKET